MTVFQASSVSGLQAHKLVSYPTAAHAQLSLSSLQSKLQTDGHGFVRISTALPAPLRVPDSSAPSASTQGHAADLRSSAAPRLPCPLLIQHALGHRPHQRPRC
jgi:hypothetical protein